MELIATYSGVDPLVDLGLSVGSLIEMGEEAAQSILRCVGVWFRV
jgi:hypothetical protein